MCFEVFKIYVFLFFCTFCQADFMYEYSHFTLNLRPHIQTVFPKLLVFVFFVKLNCGTPLFSPLGSNFQKRILLKNVLFPLINCETCSKGNIWKISMRRITDLKNQGPCKSQFCEKCVGAIHFRKNGLAITFTWPNEP